jgi:hypothetical protein
LATQAANNATDSVTCTRSQEVCRIVVMARGTSGDSSRGVSFDISRWIHDSFTTQGLASDAQKASGGRRKGPPSPCNPRRPAALGFSTGAKPCPMRYFATTRS